MKHRRIVQPSRGSDWLGVDLAWETHSTGQEKKQENAQRSRPLPKNRGWGIHWHAAPGAERPAGKGANALSTGSEAGEPL